MANFDYKYYRSTVSARIVRRQNIPDVYRNTFGIILQKKIPINIEFLLRWSKWNGNSRILLVATKFGLRVLVREIYFKKNMGESVMIAE